MKRLLFLAACAEVGTGFALLIVPALVGQLLLGQPLEGLALPVARVAGIALIGLGIACWPGPPIIGMLNYSAVVGVYLALLGLMGGSVGVLLWPAVVIHLFLAGLLYNEYSRKPGLR